MMKTFCEHKHFIIISQNIHKKLGYKAVLSLCLSQIQIKRSQRISTTPFILESWLQLAFREHLLPLAGNPYHLYLRNVWPYSLKEPSRNHTQSSSAKTFSVLGVVRMEREARHKPERVLYRSLSRLQARRQASRLSASGTRKWLTQVTQQRHRQTGFREGEGGGGTSETGVGQVV